MKYRTILPILSLLLASAAVSPAATQTPAPAASSAGTAASLWGNPKALKEQLAKAINAELPSVSEASVKAFVAKPANRLLMMQYLLACADDLTPASLTESVKTEAAKQQEMAAATLLRAELAADGGSSKKSKDKKASTAQSKLKAAKANAAGWAQQTIKPWTLAQFAASRNPLTPQILEAVTNDPEWMLDIVGTGECYNPGRILAILAGIAEQHPDVLTDKKLRDIATSVAVEWAKTGAPYHKALTRADYFIRNWKNDRLNTVFDTLPFFLMRVTCGAKVTGDHDTAQVPSMEWALENVHLPVERYTGCCWRCGYKDFSVYGENIQGPGYFAPFAGLFDEKGHQRGFQVGAVCGGLSHFGAYAAVANGVPASTMGEPGHCAYVVRVKDKWVPSYSLGWEHALHWTPWSENYCYTTLQMATELYEEQPGTDATMASHTYRALAQMAAAKGKSADIPALYTAAVEAQPLNYPAWREYALYLGKEKAGDVAAWAQYNESLSKLLAPRYPEVAAQLLTKYVYPALTTAGVKPDAALPLVHAFWDGVKERGPERWKAEDLCTAQLKLCGAESDSAGFLKFYNSVLGDVASKGDYAPIVIAWADLKSKDMSGVSEKLGKITAKKLKGSTVGSGNTDLNKAILMSAERTRDIETFQRAGHQLAVDNKKLDAPIGGLPSMDGELLSSGGMVYYNAPGKQDDLPMHWGVTEKVGGYIQSEPKAGTWIAVKLPRDSFVSGVVITTPTFQSDYCDHMQLQVSDTGEEGSWRDVGGDMGMHQRHMKVDLSTQKIKTRYLRVIRKDGDKPLHIHCFHVYGRRAA